jgi:uncharacterized membrane protein
VKTTTKPLVLEFILVVIWTNAHITILSYAIPGVVGAFGFIRANINGVIWLLDKVFWILGMAVANALGQRIYDWWQESDPDNSK